MVYNARRAQEQIWDGRGQEVWQGKGNSAENKPSFKFDTEEN